MVKVNVNPLKIGRNLFLIAIVLCIVSISLWYFPRRFLFPSYNLDELFSVDNENNIPTFFSSFLLILASGISFLTSRAIKISQRKPDHHWVVLGVGFCYMALDEYVILHEKLITLTNRVIKINNDFLGYSWVIPGMILVILLFLYFLPFIKNLPRRILFGLLLSGIFFVAGAIGFEMLGSYMFENFTFNSREYVVVVTIEEFLEMTGIIGFIYTTLRYLQDELPLVNLHFN